uniref:RHS repeat-associated core domain-containing protein n=1 Tax=uncultured Psychrobacter sp. TaxID=259303 RepID=UPI0025925716
LQYNANNELEKSLRTQYQDNNIVKTLTEYHYDAFGRRITKHSETRNFTQNKDNLRQISKTQHRHTHMLWDGDLPIQEYSDTHVYTTIYEQGSFEPVARLVWLRDELLKAANDEIKNAERESWEDAPELIPNMQVFYYHNDQLGTPNELTNDQGEVVWLADYQAWGETREEMCWGHILVSQGESCARVVEDDVWHEQQLNPLQVEKEHLQPIRFQGQHYDIETGLHYNRFRYYDPDVGMFTTRDPIGLMGGDNVFQYAPNPTGWIDPLGLVTLGEAERSLWSRGVPRDERSFLGIASYSDTQRFNEWLRLEESDMGWLGELQGLECPIRIEDVTGPNWNEVGQANEFHRPGVFEARSRETAGGHSNQCVYTAGGDLMTEPPAAGSVDKAACGIMYACPIHYLQDVQPYQLAERLGRIDDYYKVRPVH